MAKKVWTASPKQLQKINELIIKAQKTRRNVIRRYRKTVAESTARAWAVPDLIIPPKLRRRTSFKSYPEYLRQLKQLRKNFGEGERTWYKVNYKRVLVQALLDMLNSEAGYSLAKKGIEPKNGYFSKEQIKEASGLLKRFMKLYNQFKAMPIEQFMDMYLRGYIVYLRYLYRDMILKSDEAESDMTFVGEQEFLIKTYRQAMSRGRRRPSGPSGSGRTYKVRERLTKDEKKVVRKRVRAARQRRLGK